MTIRSIGLAACLVVAADLAAASIARAAAVVAIVEDVGGTATGVELMDYLSPGKVIELQGSGTVVLGYFQSCLREKVTGGRLTVGEAQSEVVGGRIERTKVACEPRTLNLSRQDVQKSGAMAFRAPPKRKAQPAPALTLHGLSPVLELPETGRVEIARVDAPAPPIVLDVAAGDLLRGAFYDFTKHGKALEAGATYRVSQGTAVVVVRVADDAKPGATPLLGRLVRLRAAK